jgi:hypothetical protein
LAIGDDGHVWAAAGTPFYPEGGSGCEVRDATSAEQPEPLAARRIDRGKPLGRGKSMLCETSALRKRAFGQQLRNGGR